MQWPTPGDAAGNYASIGHRMRMAALILILIIFSPLLLFTMSTRKAHAPSTAVEWCVINADTFDPTGDTVQSFGSTHF